MSTRKAPRTAPFLIKLFDICSRLPAAVGTWNEDGSVFQVKDPEQFFEFSKSYYSGSPKTFYRQLSYFRFVRAELLPQGFAFSHPQFRKGDAGGLASIRRVIPGSTNDEESSVGNASNSPKELVDASSDRVERLEKTVEELKGQIQELSNLVVTLVNNNNNNNQRGGRKLVLNNQDPSCSNANCKRIHLLVDDNDDTDSITFTDHHHQEEMEKDIVAQFSDVFPAASLKMSTSINMGSILPAPPSPISSTSSIGISAGAIPKYFQSTIHSSNPSELSLDG